MRFLIVLLAFLAVLAGADAAKAEKRVAFVVGNGAYKSVVKLPNPPIDARAMASLLRNVGFEVVEGIDLTRDRMTERLLEFGEKTRGADIAIFYYAGHGIAVDGVNYLLPVDADLKSELDVKLGRAINIDLTLDQTMNDARVKLVFLDACRDNPFAAKIKAGAASRSVTVHTGLAEMKSGEGTLIAFATSPGRTASDGKSGTNSPFTRALIDHLTTPGVEIQQAMTEVRAQVNDETNKAQLPWGHTNLIGAVYLNPVAAPAGSPAAAAGVPAATVGTSSEVELEFWRSIKDSNKVEEFNAYLSSYPNGQFRSIALARIAALEKGTATRAPTVGVDPAAFTDEPSQLSEDQLGLSRNQRREVQRRLNGLGFDTAVTGKFDVETRVVIARWQAARGYPGNGFLNKPQHQALLAETVAMPQTTDDSSNRPARRARQTGGSRVPPPMGLDGPGGFIGGVVGGMLGGRR
jgi:hypothetical protein